MTIRSRELSDCRDEEILNFLENAYSRSWMDKFTQRGDAENSSEIWTMNGER